VPEWKRGNLYLVRVAAQQTGSCSALDDCAESFMMASLMRNGFLRTMKANYKIDAGDLFGVIRPMVYCKGELMTDFAKSSESPVINSLPGLLRGTEKNERTDQKLP
jgi:hypothetical protein